MKKRAIIISGLTGLLVLSSCNEDKIISNNQLVRTISVTGQDFVDGDGIVGTRASYSVDGTGFHFTWTQGDTVGIYPVGGDQVAFPISSGEGSQTAQFDGGAWALRSSYSYAAYYPFSLDNYKRKETSIPISYLGQVQKGNGALDGLSNFDYQASVATQPDENGNVEIALKHLGCFVRFQLTMPSADSYKSLTISSNKTRFVTTGTFNLTNDDVIIYPKSTSESIRITLTNTSTAEENKLLTVYAMLPPADYSDSEFTINITGLSSFKYTTSFSGKNMLAGMSYNYSSSCSIVNSLPDPSQTEAVYGDITIYKAYADSTDITSFDLKAQIDGLSSLDGYAVYFYYSETEIEPNVSSGTRVKASVTDGNMASYRLENMSMCSTYYFRVAVMTFEGDVLYGPSNYHTVTDIVTKGDMIDIGIPGVKFASCNLGADSPEEVGNYYGWGDIESVSNINSYTYPFYNKDMGIWKNLGADIGGTQYDAATMSLGDGWHIPNDDLMSKLSTLCNTENISYKGVEGSLVIGNNGNAIFIPGTIWTSSISKENEGEAIPYPYIGFKCYDRRRCFPIRPVYGTLSYPMEYVDLGLSVKWATCNIGACVPEDYGYYYVWGETELKKICSWDTYKYCKSFDNMTKYCNSIAYGYNEFTDTLTTLTPDDDVAYVKWGGDWRMPTQADFDELLNNCDWVWTTQNGVKGYKVTSRKDSSLSIFMPVAGYRQGTMIPPNSGGKYWSSSLYTDTPDRAWTLSFNSVAQHIGYEQRIYGLSVRPVCP